MEREIEYTVRNKLCSCVVFDKIEDEDQSYFIGYMSSDGSYERCKGNLKEYPRMSLTTTNKYIADYFSDRFCKSASVRPRGLRSSEKVKSINEAYDIAFPCKMSDMFKRFGILDYKQNRICIGVPKDFFGAYFLGVLDADGCFVVRHRKDCRSPRLSVHIVSSALKILEELQRRLLELEINSSIYQRKDSNCSELRINHTQQSIKLGKLVYSKLPSIYNFKKKKIFDTFLQSCPNSGELLET